MATGSQSDFIGRLQSWLPSRWFPTQPQNTDGSVPRIYAMLSGAAAVFGQIWVQLQYGRAQTRLATSNDGWLDLGISDLTATSLLRKPGEIDAAYWARVQPQLLPKANTRGNIEAALESLTGQPVRMIEPWDARDNAAYDYRSFYGIDLAVAPGNYSNGDHRYESLVQCVLPASASLGSLPQRRFYDGAFYSNTAGYGWYWDDSTGFQGGAPLVYSLLNRLKMFGTQIFVLFTS